MSPPQLAACPQEETAGAKRRRIFGKKKKIGRKQQQLDPPCTWFFWSLADALKRGDGNPHLGLPGAFIPPGSHFVMIFIRV